MIVYKFIFLFTIFLLLFGCNYILTKKSTEKLLSTVENLSAKESNTVPDSYYLRYYNFQHANSTTREAQLEFMDGDSKQIQAILLSGESFSSSFCNNQITVKFEGFTDLDYNFANITINYLNKTTQFNISRNNNDGLEFYCNNITQKRKMFSTRKEAKHVFVGEKEFTLENDLFSDNSCDLGKKYKEIKLEHNYWYSLNFNSQPELRRYMFRPNTVFCIGSSMYVLEEDNESRQCYTMLGKRDPETTGCKNLEGVMGNE